MLISGLKESRSMLQYPDMRIAPTCAALLTTLPAALVCCDRPAHCPLTQEEQEAFLYLAELVPDFPAFLTYYQQTGDAKSATAEGYTMLHLACAVGNERLVAQLLRCGANPEALAGERLTPLNCLFELAATAEDGGYTDRDTRLRIADLLQQAGAHLDSGSPMMFGEMDEETYLYLLEHFPVKGAADAAAEETPGTLAASRGWARALRLYLQKVGQPLKGADTELLHVVATYDGQGVDTGQYRDCALLLLEHGTPLEGRDADDMTPLMAAADGHLFSGNPDGTPGEVLLLLLERGADVFLTAGKDSRDAGVCAYDYLMANAPLMEQLKERGITFPAPPPLSFTEGRELMHTVTHAQMRVESVESLRAGFGQICTLLHPTAEMRREPDYRDVLCSAVSLLLRADRTRAAEAIATMDIWRETEFWLPEDDVPAALLTMLHEERISLPSELLLPLAHKLVAEGEHGTAASMLELLAYDEQAETKLTALTEDESPVIRAAAWQARLLHRELPAAKVGEIASWLAAHDAEADSPELQRMLRLTSLDRYWMEEMKEEEQRLLLEDMKDIGVPEVAEWYAKLPQAMDNPDLLHGQRHEEALYPYLLETATARYFLEHEHVLRAKESPDNPVP